MPSRDYIDGFNAAKFEAEKVAKDEIAAAKKELDLNRVKPRPAKQSEHKSGSNMLRRSLWAFGNCARDWRCSTSATRIN